jgi:hypothetical protein
MSATIMWALLTGFITGGVWVAIVLLRRQRRWSEQQPAPLEEVQGRLDHLEHGEKRLAESAPRE